jgi:hypothetical protein
MPWDLTGNNGTNPANNFLGTTDQQPLVIRTNNTERLRLTPDGDLMASRNATIGAGGDAVLKTRHVVGKSGSNDNDDALHLNWATGRPVFIGNPDGRASLFVSGEAVIGYGGDAVLRTRHVVGKSGSNDNDDALHLNWATGRPVIIGNPNRRASLSVNGPIQSTAGGFQFPDGSVQTTATLRGAPGQTGQTGPAGPAVRTFATCLGAPPFGNATCDCGNARLQTREIADCFVTSETGSCSAGVIIDTVSGTVRSRGSCCVCAPT